MTGLQFLILAGMDMLILILLSHNHAHMQYQEEEHETYGNPNLRRPTIYDIPLPEMIKNKDGEWLLSLSGHSGIVGCTLKGDPPQEAFNQAWQQLQKQYASKYEIQD